MLHLLKKFAGNKTTFDTIVGPGTTIVGDMTFTGDVRVDGQLVGDIATYKSTSGTIVVGKSGAIHGDVVVSNAVVSGAIHGSVNATALVGVASTGRIIGDVTYDRLVVHEKAHIHGRLSRANHYSNGREQAHHSADYEDTDPFFQQVSHA